MTILDAQSIYLVGIKGVAMTALAQCLVDAGKQVRGCDVAETFVTQPILDKLQIAIDEGFDHEFPTGVDAVVFTSAHQGPDNPLVRLARQHQLPTWSHAEALSHLFNQKIGVAVCGVGGKSTTSAMGAWMLQRLAPTTTAKPSFAIGVGNIPGLEITGQWSPTSQVFVAEADEYVTDPKAAVRGEEITPRFSFLNPKVVVCTNLKFDHPDVYRDFDHTRQVYTSFFLRLKPQGTLIVNGDDRELLALATEVARQRQDIEVISFGHHETCDAQVDTFTSSEGTSTLTFRLDQPYTIQLKLPGEFNCLNALAAGLAVKALNAELNLQKALDTLSTFRSTKRRSEFVGEKQGVLYYDDYAHHPTEVANIIRAFQDWYPQRRVVIAFQSHTYSRTKQLFTDFVAALAMAHEVVMIDIFASAREAFDPSVTSDLLCEAIQAQSSQTSAKNVGTLAALAEFCTTELKARDVLITVGAGDIYQVHDLIKA